MELSVIEMEAKNIANKIFKIKDLLEENEGVSLCASLKRGFEPWLKVELCGILNHYGNVVPEVSHTFYKENKKITKKIDIVFNNEWAISLKDRKKGGKKGENKLLRNLKEIEEKPYCNYPKSCLVFLIFHPNGKKDIYDEQIKNLLLNKNRIYCKKDFTFNDNCFKKNNKGSLWFVVGK